MNRAIVLISLICFFAIPSAKAQFFQDELNPAFSKAYKKTGADIKKENEEAKTKKYYKTNFKRRRYEGPSYKEAKELAERQVYEKIKEYFPVGNFAFKVGDFSYEASSDVVTLSELVAVPKKGTKEEGKIPYFFKIDQARLIGFNLGEFLGMPVSEQGVIELRKIDLPKYNDYFVQVGKTEIGQVRLDGAGLDFIKKGKAEFKEIRVNGLSTQSIIDQILLGNIVRAKKFETKLAIFSDATLSTEIINSIKAQNLKGLTFAVAAVNGSQYTSMDAINLVFTSYSARVLDVEKIAAVKQEMDMKKEKADLSKERLQILKMEKQKKLENLKKEALN